MASVPRATLPWLLAAACAVASAGPQEPLRHVARGSTSDAAAGNAFLVIHTADDLATALNRHASRAAPSDTTGVRDTVDFDKEIVLGVMLSRRPTGCAGVDITSIAHDGIVSVVHYRERRLRKGEACQGRLLSPFDFVAVARSNAPFRFMQDAEP